MNPARAFIYSLNDPQTNTVRYIGQTASPPKRYMAHIRDSKNTHPASTKIQCWIHNLVASGLRPVMEIIEECDEKARERREKYWYDYYRGMGCDLLNTVDCGRAREIVRINKVLSLTELQSNELEELSDKTDLPVSEHIKMAIDLYLESVSGQGLRVGVQREEG